MRWARQYLHVVSTENPRNTGLSGASLGPSLLVLKLGSCFPCIYITVSNISLENSEMKTRYPGLGRGRRKRHPSQSKGHFWQAVRELFFPEWAPAPVPCVHTLHLVSNDMHL